MEQMWADVLNKPNHGKAFGVFCSQLMKIPEEYDDDKEAGKTRHLLFTPMQKERKTKQPPRNYLTKWWM